MEKVKNKLYKLDNRIDWAFVYNREEQDYFAGGEEKGWVEGKQETQIETATNMLKDGMSPQLVQKYTKLSMNEIELILKSL